VCAGTPIKAVAVIIMANKRKHVADAKANINSTTAAAAKHDSDSSGSDSSGSDSSGSDSSGSDSSGSATAAAAKA
jgi:hypothetical protein